jgi:hypothetical protein
MFDVAAAAPPHFFLSLTLGHGSAASNEIAAPSGRRRNRKLDKKLSINSIRMAL